jgi:hypothetical protein
VFLPIHGRGSSCCLVAWAAVALVRRARTPPAALPRPLTTGAGMLVEPDLDPPGGEGAGRHPGTRHHGLAPGPCGSSPAGEDGLVATG